MPDQQSDRREFLAGLGLLPLLGSAGLTNGGDETKLIADPTRPLQPSAADLGTNFAAVEQIAAACQPSVFPIGKEIDFNPAFRAAARARVRDVLSYEPPHVDFKPEVVERVDCGDFWRERVLIATTPWFRIPAHVLIPKNLKTPAPAIVDLHSHGGMFLFGKEKVIDWDQPSGDDQVPPAELRRPPHGHRTRETRLCCDLDRRLHVWRASCAA